jgi:hypothetical protein
MNRIFLAVTLLSLGRGNATYNEAVNRQMTDGYRWVEIS